MRLELTQFKTAMISYQHSVERTARRDCWSDSGVHRNFAPSISALLSVGQLLTVSANAEYTEILIKF